MLILQVKFAMFLLLVIFQSMKVNMPVGRLREGASVKSTLARYIIMYMYVCTVLSAIHRNEAIT